MIWFLKHIGESGYWLNNKWHLCNDWKIAEKLCEGNTALCLNLWDGKLQINLQSNNLKATQHRNRPYVPPWWHIKSYLYPIKSYQHQSHLPELVPWPSMPWWFKLLSGSFLNVTTFSASTNHPRKCNPDYNRSLDEKDLSQIFSKTSYPIPNPMSLCQCPSFASVRSPLSFLRSKETNQAFPVSPHN